MNFKKSLFCRIPDLDADFLTRIVDWKITEFMVFAAKYETNRSISPVATMSTSAMDAFRSAVLAVVPTAKFYAWIYSSVGDTTPNITGSSNQQTIIDNISAFLSTYTGRFDGVLDDMESWAGMSVADRFSFVTHCATHLDSLTVYLPWMYYAFTRYVTSKHIAVGMYDAEPYDQTSTPYWKTAYEYVMNNYSPFHDDCWIFIETTSNPAKATIAQQCNWLLQEDPDNYPQMAAFGLFWYYSMDSQDMTDWHTFVDSLEEEEEEEPEEPPEPEPEESTADILISGVDRSDLIQRIELWLKDVECVGRFNLTFFNDTPITVNPNALVYISKSTAPLMRGHVDVVEEVLEETETEKCISTLNLSGRDFVQDFQNLINGKIYNPMKADDLIAALLADSESTVNFISPSSAPQVYFQPKGKYLSDCVKDILELIDYSGFIDWTNTWKMFPHDGSVNHLDSGITLKSIAEDPTNNIIKWIKRSKSDTLDLRNYAIVFIDSSDFEFCEQNASDWAAAEGSDTPTDYSGTSPTTPRAGVSAIKFTTIDNINFGGVLNFPLYGISYIDYSLLTNTVNVTFDTFINGSSGNDMYFTVTLTDNLGNKIHYSSSTDFPTGAQQWGNFSVPFGTQQIYSYDNNDHWSFNSGYSSFTWKIVSIKINGGLAAEGTQVQYVLLDNLKIPDVQPIAVDKDDTSISTYWKRQVPLTKSDFGTYTEALQYATSIKDKRKDPLEKLTLWAKGDAGLVSGAWVMLPGYRVNVTIDKLGLTNASYRFVEIHHIIDRAAPTMGWNHIVEVSLVPATAKLQTMLWSYGKDQGSISRGLRDRLNSLETKARDANNWFEDLP